MDNSNKLMPEKSYESKFKLGKRLTELRVGFGYTIKEVSKSTGVPVDYIERLEDGSKEIHPSTNALYKLADFYKADLKELLKLGGIIIPNPPVEQGEEKQLIKRLWSLWENMAEAGELIANGDFPKIYDELEQKVKKYL